MIYLISQNEVIEVFTSTHLNQVILSSIEQVLCGMWQGKY